MIPIGLEIIQWVQFYFITYFKSYIKFFRLERKHQKLYKKGEGWMTFFSKGDKLNI